MNEPRRWLDPQAGAPAEVRALLGAALRPAELPLPARARVRAAVHARRGQHALPAMTLAAGLGAALTCAAVGWAPWAQVRPQTTSTVARTGPAAATDRREPATRAAQTHAVGDAREPVAEGPPRALASAPRGSGRADTGQRERPPHRRPPTEAQLERWRQQRWANEARRSRERIAALVDEILKPDARLLERAGKEVKHDPGRALALIEAFRKRHPMAEIPAPAVVVEVDALRRLGRFDEALERARSFVDVSRKDYYSDEMRERFAFLEL